MNIHHKSLNSSPACFVMHVLDTYNIDLALSNTYSRAHRSITRTCDIK